MLARVRGKLRNANAIKSTNPVAVGDRVSISKHGEEDYTIDDLHDRKNYIIRKATKLSSQTHIVAANLDQALLITTLVQPQIKLGFIDRFLVTAAAYDIPTTIIFNKTDLCDETERAYLDELCKAYGKVGYESLCISVATGEGIDEVRKLVEGKISLISGHSGVGKTSLLNTLNPALNEKVTEVSSYTEKGKHTTTFAEMHEINARSFIVDTPGLKSFGLTLIKPAELKDFFPEMVKLSPECKFHNCLHLNEPGCAVRAAYENSELPWFRYENYQYFLKELRTEAA